jgi:hypothetical protein
VIVTILAGRSTFQLCGIQMSMTFFSCRNFENIEMDVTEINAAVSMEL